MSFQRRWFLTAAGSAFLASIAGIVEAAEATRKAPRRKKLGKPEDDADLIFTDFTLGYGNLLPAEEKMCREFFDDTYGGRWKSQYPSLTDKEISDLGGMANALGQLAKGALSNEKSGRCGWKKDENAVLREAHLQQARDMLGFHLNKRVNLGKRCGTAAKLSIMQPDQPCPLCQV